MNDDNCGFGWAHTYKGGGEERVKKCAEKVEKVSWVCGIITRPMRKLIGLILAVLRRISEILLQPSITRDYIVSPYIFTVVNNCYAGSLPQNLSAKIKLLFLHTLKDFVIFNNLHLFLKNIIYLTYINDTYHFKMSIWRRIIAFRGFLWMNIYY